MIEIQEPFGILGVGFGRLIAQEVSSILNPKFTIVISSIDSKSQIPLLLKLLPNYILKSIPYQCFKAPKTIVNYIFSAQQKHLLHEILMRLILNLFNGLYLHIGTGNLRIA